MMFGEEEICIDIDIKGIEDSEMNVIKNINELYAYKSEQEQEDFIMGKAYEKIREQYNIDVIKNKKLMSSIGFDLKESLRELDDDGGIL